MLFRAALSRLFLAHSLIALPLAFLASACFTPGKVAAVSVHGIVASDYSVDSSSDDDLSGYGVEGHVMLLGPDLSLGYELREIADEDAEEIFIGSRFFIIESVLFSPYVSARVRYSPDGIDVPSSDSYTGYALGIGTFVWLGPFFVDGNIHYEGLFSDPDVGGSETGFDGLTATIGIGFGF